MIQLVLLLLVAFFQEPELDAEDKVRSEEPPIVERGSHTLLDPIEEEIERAESEGAFDPVVEPEPEPELPAEVPDPELPELVLETDVGEATHYGGRFHGRRTASGERFDQNGMTAAHRTYPFGTIVRVTNQNNGRSVVLRINDRGPYGPAKKAKRKIIDVSRAAARELGFYHEGRVVVRVEVLEWGSGRRRHR